MLALEAATSIIKRVTSLVIICHAEPDGDALGASLALRAGLHSIGKKAVVVCKDNPAPTFQFLPDIEVIVRRFPTRGVEALIIVDCGDLTRTGFPDHVLDLHKNGIPIINIDHHPKNDLHRLAAVNLVDEEVAASVQIIARLLKELEVLIAPPMATQLLTGLYTDTGGFKHSNTSPEVLNLAAQLLLAGGRLKKIVHNISATKPLAALRLWGLALSRVRKHPTLPLVLSVITQQDLETCKAAVDDLGGIVNVINGIPGTRAAVLFTELPAGEIKVSIRTETEGVDVSRIASLFGGGGHKKAAGFRLKGKVQKTHHRWIIEPVLSHAP